MSREINMTVTLAVLCHTNAPIKRRITWTPTRTQRLCGARNFHWGGGYSPGVNISRSEDPVRG